MTLPGADALPPIDQALLPARVRSGDATAKSAYETGLAFEQMLVSELSQQLAQTAPGDGSGDGGADGGDGGSDFGAGASDPAGGAYAQLLPSALSSSVMSAGGLGIAQQIAGALDPALDMKR